MKSISCKSPLHRCCQVIHNLLKINNERDNRGLLFKVVLPRNVTYNSEHIHCYTYNDEYIYSKRSSEADISRRTIETDAQRK